MKAREGSRRFSDPKKRLAPGEVLRKFGWRREVVCEIMPAPTGVWQKITWRPKG